MAGLPALHGSEPGQVRKEAATAIFCKCRGQGSPPINRSAEGGTISAEEAEVRKDVNYNARELILAGILALAAGPALAIDGVAVEGGSGDGADMGRIALQWDWGKRWLEGQNWH